MKLNSNPISIDQARARGLQVAELAERSGVTPATIRYYSRSGLLHPQRNPYNDYRYFSSADIQRVQFTRRAQELGLKIADIKLIFESVAHGETPCGTVKSLVRQRLAEVCRQIDELRATRNRISAAIKEWEEIDNVLPDDARFCPLIEKLGCAHQATT